MKYFALLILLLSVPGLKSNNLQNQSRGRQMAPYLNPDEATVKYRNALSVALLLKIKKQST